MFQNPFAFQRLSKAPISLNSRKILLTLYQNAVFEA